MFIKEKPKAFYKDGKPYKVLASNWQKYKGKDFNTTSFGVKASKNVEVEPNPIGNYKIHCGIPYLIFH